MPYKFEKQPLCRSCGQPIRKHTTPVWVVAPDSKSHMTDRHVVGPLYNKEECQKRVNEQVVSISYWGEPDSAGRKVSYFGVWDGESYVDPYFCGGPCRDRLAYACARDGRVMPEYNDAIRRLAGEPITRAEDDDLGIRRPGVEPTPTNGAEGRP